MPNPDEKDIVDETAAVVERLRALSNLEHDDLSIGDEAADLIERLSRERGTVPEGWDYAMQCALTCLEANERIKHPEWDGSATPGSPIGLLRTALSAAPQLREWQPIGTAPMDGTFVLLFCEGATCPSIARWNGDGWGDELSTYHIHGLNYPTHWMPLPTPPAALYKVVHMFGGNDNG